MHTRSKHASYAALMSATQKQPQLQRPLYMRRCTPDSVRGGSGMEWGFGPESKKSVRESRLHSLKGSVETTSLCNLKRSSNDLGGQNPSFAVVEQMHCATWDFR